MALRVRSALLCCALLSNSLWALPTRYDTVRESLNEIERLHSRYARVFTIGLNDESVPIEALRVSSSPRASDARKPGFFVVSTHHGNELLATDFTLAFARRVLERFEKRSFEGTFTDAEWVILPVVNIPGYNTATREERGVDPNRDYPGVCGSEPHDRLASTRHVQALMQARRFAASVTVHGYVGSLTYPWGVRSTNIRTLDHNRFAQLASKAAQHNQYRTGTSTDIVYAANNTFEDYAYHRFGTWSLLLELKNGSARDIRSSVTAIETFFDLVDSSPSVSNQHLGQCDPTAEDLRLE